jgi:hypothetical protein
MTPFQTAALVGASVASILAGVLAVSTGLRPRRR